MFRVPCNSFRSTAFANKCGNNLFMLFSPFSFSITKYWILLINNSFINCSVLTMILITPKNKYHYSIVKIFAEYKFKFTLYGVFFSILTNNDVRNLTAYENDMPRQFMQRYLRVIEKHLNRHFLS